MKATSVRRPTPHSLLPTPLSAEPVRDLHEEGVVRMQPEEIVVLFAPALPAGVRQEGLASVRPHSEDRGAWPVLPPQHGVGAQLLEVEANAGTRGRREQLIARVVRGG